jgi:hypothetical protein
MKKSLIKRIVSLTMVLTIAISAFAFTAQLALAQANLDPFGGFKNNIESDLNLGNRDPREIAGSVINVIMGFLGIIAVVIILLGGFKWMTAGGDESKIEEAKKLMTAGVIGLVIILAAWGVTTFVMRALLNATGADQNVV